RVPGIRCTKTQAGVTTARHGVAGVDGSAIILREDHQEHPDRALTDDEYVFAFGHASLADGFQAGVYRLDECGFLKANVVGHGNHAALDNPGHGANVFGKASAIGVKAGREARFLVTSALREELSLAVETVGARNVMEADDAVAGLEFLHTFADLHNGSGKFVAEDLRRLDKAV